MQFTIQIICKPDDAYQVQIHPNSLQQPPQVVLFADDKTVSKGMVKYATQVPKESIVDVEGVVTLPQASAFARRTITLLRNWFWACTSAQVPNESTVDVEGCRRQVSDNLITYSTFDMGLRHVVAPRCFRSPLSKLSVSSRCRKWSRCSCIHHFKLSSRMAVLK